MYTQPNCESRSKLARHYALYFLKLKLLIRSTFDRITSRGYAEEGVLVGCRILTGFLVGYIEGGDSQCYTKEEGFNSHKLVILFGSLWVFET